MNHSMLEIGAYYFRSMEVLLAIGLLISSVEYFYIFKNFSQNRAKIWDENILASEWHQIAGIELNSKKFFSHRNFKYFALLKAILAILFLFQVAQSQSTFLNNLFLIPVIWLLHILFCLRFRGTFNGGSDMMTNVLLTGITIGMLPFLRSQEMALFYVAIHSLISYFKAGVVKIRHKDWRTGLAIPHFLKRSVFHSGRRLGDFFLRHHKVSFFLSWATLLFELTVPLVLFSKPFFAFWLGWAFLFHIGVYLLFGLNRFFWLWIATWPAISYVVHQLN
jgi:hypothetical protein